ncbi:MAG: hypothetical protein WBE40_01690 [Thermoplasmata archaeon]
MAFPYVAAFLILLLAYMTYSEWAGLDSRYPIGAALGLLVVTAAADATGSAALANTLAEFVFFLLAGGVVLLLVDYARDRRPSASAPERRLGLRPWSPQSTEATDEWQRTTDQTLDRPE